MLQPLVIQKNHGHLLIESALHSLEFYICKHHISLFIIGAVQGYPLHIKAIKTGLKAHTGRNPKCMTGNHTSILTCFLTCDFTTFVIWSA